MQLVNFAVYECLYINRDNICDVAATKHEESGQLVHFALHPKQLGFLRNVYSRCHALINSTCRMSKGCCCLQKHDSGYMNVFSTTIEDAMACFLWRMSQLLQRLPDGQLPVHSHNNVCMLCCWEISVLSGLQYHTACWASILSASAAGAHLHIALFTMQLNNPCLEHKLNNAFAAFSHAICLLCLQASLSTLQAISEQLVVTVIPKLVPDWPLVPSTSSLKNALLFPSLLFVTAVCRKQSNLGKVLPVMLCVHKSRLTRHSCNKASGTYDTSCSLQALLCCSMC